MKTIRIFLSSPGDVAAERTLARGVIADLQKRYTGSFLLQPVFWEDLPLGSDVSFQEGIDVVLSAGGGIDIAVFILWSRLGSPLGARIRKADGSDYLSGTEREWDLMLRARGGSGGARPDILTYLRDDQNGFIATQRGKDQPQLLEMVLQQGKVRDFVAEHFTDRETGTNVRAFFSFREPITFAHRLRTHLRAWLDQRLVDADLAAVVWHPAEQGSPFRGLEVFEYEHAPLFFGREQEVCDLQIRLRQQAGAGCAFVLLVGASGSGKSSLARAGVAPAVAQFDREDEAAEWRRAVFTPGIHRDDLLLGLVRALAAPHALPELAGENFAELADGLARDPELTFRFKLRPLFTGNRCRLLLIFDQVEELFTHGEITVEARRRLGAALGVVARSGCVWVLATVRSDYYARFQAVPELLALKGEGAHVDLPPPALAELQRIITQPARAAGLRFEENEKGEPLDARLLADAAEHPEALPLLEFCLDALYQRQAARGDGVLRWADYEAMRGAATAGHDAASARAESGLAGALVSQAEAALASLPAEHQRQCLSAIFSKLLDLSSAFERETPVRRTALEAELVRNPYRRGENGRRDDDDEELPGARAFLQAFTARRLLVSGAAGGSGQQEQRTYTVAHEALLRNWWRLRRLQAEQAEFFRVRRQVERAQADWQAAGHDDSFLLAEGLPLQLARRLAAEAPELLTGPLTDYIARSSARAERLRRRRRRLTTGVIAGLTLLAAGAGVGAWFGFLGEQNARRQAAIAQEQTGIAQTKTEEAEERTSEAKVQIHQALLSDLATARNLLGKGNWREALMYLRRAQHYDDPDNRLASASLWTEVVYGRDDREGLPQVAIHPEEAVLGLSYSPDGTRIVTACDDGTVQQWDAATGQPIDAPLRHEKAVWSAAYSPDGARLVTACDDGTVQQWDAATGQRIGQPLRHEQEVTSAAYSPDGKRIVTASTDKTARQWDAATGQPIGPPLPHERGVWTAVYSPDGTRIVTACAYGSAQQWDAGTGKPIGSPLYHDSKPPSAAAHKTKRAVKSLCLVPSDPPQVRTAAYSPDGARIVTAGDDHTARQWDTATGQPIGEPLRQKSEVERAAYSPDGARIVIACGDRTVRQWDAATGKPLGEFLRGSKAVYSPDGARIATASGEKTVRQWDAATGKPMGEPLRHQSIGDESLEEMICSAAYSPDGTRVVTASDDKTAQQWDVATGRPIGGPLRHNALVSSAAYSPDGRRIVTTEFNGAVRQWEVATGTLIGELAHYEGGAHTADYSPDGTRILTIPARIIDMVRQWDAATGRPIGVPLHHKLEVYSAAYSPDGTRVVTASSDATAQQWDAATGQPIGEPLRHEAGVNHARYSPDGTRIVTASSDGTAQQWDAATGKPIGAPLRHNDYVRSAAYSPDGGRIVTIEGSNIARQWEAATGKPLGEPLRHDASGVYDVTYSPDGKRILTVCSDGTARQWDCWLPSTPPPKWLDDFVQMLSGLRFDDNGKLQNLSGAERDALQIALHGQLDATPPKSNDWEQLARWASLPPSQRSYTPNSFRSTLDVATRELACGRQASVENALRLVPNLPLAHLTLAEFAEYADRADFLRRYELAHLPPADASLRLRAAAMLRAQKQPRLALQALEDARPAPPPAADFLASLALTRWLCDDKDGAVRDGQRLLTLDPGFANPAASRAGPLPEADATALAAALAETVRRHPELAPKPSPTPGP